MPDGRGHRIEIDKASSSIDKRCTAAKRTFVWKPTAGVQEQGAPEDWVQFDPACPSLERIAKLMRLRGGQTLAETRCGTGKFPRNATVIVAERAQDESSGMTEMNMTKIFVLEGSRVIARYHPGEYADVTGVFDDHRLVHIGDLDGDGVDELMIEKRMSSPMGFESQLLVFRVRGGSLVKISEHPYQAASVPSFQPQSEHEEPRFTPEDTLACDATVTLVPRVKSRGAELVVKRTPRIGSKVPKTALAGFCGLP